MEDNVEKVLDVVVLIEPTDAVVVEAPNGLVDAVVDPKEFVAAVVVVVVNGLLALVSPEVLDPATEVVLDVLVDVKVLTDVAIVDEVEANVLIEAAIVDEVAKFVDVAELADVGTIADVGVPANILTLVVDVNSPEFVVELDAIEAVVGVMAIVLDNVIDSVEDCDV